MALYNMKTLLSYAEENNLAIGAFNVSNLEMVLGVLKAAEETNTPVILQIAEGRLNHSPLSYIGPMMVGAAKNAKVPVAVQFDHGESMNLIREALNIGFSSIMFDGSHLPLEENIKKINEVSALCKSYGATTEAELGTIGGTEDDGTPKDIIYTNPGVVPYFLGKTSVDALAIAIGNVHGAYQGNPHLQLSILEEVHKDNKTPLVLHGGSGLSSMDYRNCIDRGIRKINIATSTFQCYVNAVQEYLQSHEHYNYFKLHEHVVLSIMKNTMDHIYIFNNKGAIN
ncbi:ketose-bisphosphate aldolase [Proteiniclasticum ruminis]|uniref:Fructose-bisphosphate aldolase, class II n=1 Tax=Proteiniclasticum ruminis TaxID=398199 RepID=A0A1G8JUR9_9CLOT|nr:ketose-bisphosphate aldolase [Proteiniclasticum ruminis]SDI34350.1 fructose-bisphosphate aldolase, class II [Proteiniclasticum ruminis]